MNDITRVLEMTDHPAFCAEDGVITAVNPAAAKRQFEIGAQVSELLTAGADEYREFQTGYLWLELRCCGEDYDACVRELGGRHIFTLEQADADSELRLLALAAQAIREPLGNVMALLEELDAPTDTAARIERGLYQLLRIVGNMSPPPAARPELQDVGALLREVWDKVQPACESRGVKLHYTEPPMAVLSNVDGELLTRAVHNLLSNSLKFAEPGDTLRLELKRLKKSYRILLRDRGGHRWPISDPFTRYRREPGLGDGREGLGLGLKLVQIAASAHGGTVLLYPDGEELIAELSLPIRQDTTLRSPRLRISYAGERDPMLVELSDVLPPEFYQK